LVCGRKYSQEYTKNNHEKLCKEKEHYKKEQLKQLAIEKIKQMPDNFRLSIG